ncbi:glycerate kinase type-2 family protein [Oceaniglobus roseus]|uniref:glycerate kinase type-2 family protein n=1 Tax=Oceaniglobus roseus TaxID=1737570 RepID=UPI000C7F165A|nr:DUF4147 domain-containing protein [Kandeliimicrobium roseum]
MSLSNAIPTDDLRDAAREIFLAAVAAADPARAVSAALDDRPLPRPGPGGLTRLVAIGKAAPAMMAAALARVDGPREALCITHKGNGAPCPGARLLHAGHPVPDADGLAAGRAVLDLLAPATAEDRVVALISGGGSALVPAPAEGLTLEDKIALNRALLSSGLDIVAMNLIRQQVSRLKGGGLLRVAAPAPVSALILSDVIGDDLRAIASGPTVSPLGTREEAAALLKGAGIWADVPEAVRAHLDRPAPGVPEIEADNRMVGSNGQSLAAARLAAEAAGFAARIVSDRLVGDVAEAAEALHAAAAALPAGAPPTALLWGGETTVRLRGKGMGGRNQELALRLARRAAEAPIARVWAGLSGGTDGRDGPTEAAGGIVDQGSWARIGAAGGDAAALLADNDSHAALGLSGDLLVTGATGTNVADIQVLLSRPAPA